TRKGKGKKTKLLVHGEKKITSTKPKRRRSAKQKAHDRCMSDEIKSAMKKKPKTKSERKKAFKKAVQKCKK
ncbi:MAG: hypothetical protein ABIJ56_18925, partial [Pseudomonadota bacterium]